MNDHQQGAATMIREAAELGKLLSDSVFYGAEAARGDDRLVVVIPGLFGGDLYPEAPDNETVAHLSVDLGSRGTVNIFTLPAIPIAILRAKLKRPKQIAKT